MGLLELVELFKITENADKAREIGFSIAKIIPISYEEYRAPYSGEARSATIYFAGTGCPLCFTADFLIYGPSRYQFEWSRLSLS